MDYQKRFPYTLHIDRLGNSHVHKLVNFCQDRFGVQYDRWHYNANNMAISSSNNEFWDHLDATFYFQRQEDLVMFKLCYMPEPV